MLASEPRLLLLDEALAGLTPGEIQRAIELVREIHRLGITIVIVEHVMEVILTLTRRVLVFNQGHIIASGSAAGRGQRPRGDRGLSRPRPWPRGKAVVIARRSTPHPTLPLKGGGGRNSVAHFSAPHALFSPPPLRGRAREGGATR